MRHIYIFISIALFMTSCEVFVIKAPHREAKTAVDMTQRTPLGAVYLLKAELDSNNVLGAMSIIASPQGNKYLAIERYERINDLSRLKRMIAQKRITEIRTDTLSADTFDINLEFDWSKKMKFTASKIDNSWYVVDYKCLY